MSAQLGTHLRMTSWLFPSQTTAKWEIKEKKELMNQISRWIYFLNLSEQCRKNFNVIPELGPHLGPGGIQKGTRIFAELQSFAPSPWLSSFNDFLKYDSNFWVGNFHSSWALKSQCRQDPRVKRADLGRGRPQYPQQSWLRMGYRQGRLGKRSKLLVLLGEAVQSLVERWLSPTALFFPQNKKHAQKDSTGIEHLSYLGSVPVSHMIPKHCQKWFLKSARCLFDPITINK